MRHKLVEREIWVNSVFFSNFRAIALPCTSSTSENEDKRKEKKSMPPIVCPSSSLWHHRRQQPNAILRKKYCSNEAIYGKNVVNNLLLNLTTNLTNETIFFSTRPEKYFPYLSAVNFYNLFQLWWLSWSPSTRLFTEFLYTEQSSLLNRLIRVFSFLVELLRFAK